MARHNNRPDRGPDRESQSGDDDLALFSEDELGPDHTVANKMMDNRVRVDGLSVAAKVKLAEALVAFDARKVLLDPDDEQVTIAEGAFQDFLDEKLTELEQGDSGLRCFYCKEPVSPDQEMYRVVGWVFDEDDKKVRCREKTDEIAHQECIDRLSEGADPGAAPMF